MRYQLIGVAGTGMAGLAALLRARGHEVRGSDQGVYPPMSTLLAELGVPVLAPFSAANLDWAPDRVVVGNVCRRDHVEVAAAQARGLPLTSLPAVLEDEFLAPPVHPVVVAGTHGKTTTSALLAHLLRSGGCDPSWLVGGVPRDTGRSAHLGAGPHFVVEGDEYDSAFFDKGPKFLHYRPRTLLLTSIEYDHADIYPSLDAVVAAFAKLVDLLPPDGRLIACVDSPAVAELAARSRAPVWSYGRAGAATASEWTLAGARGHRGRTRFSVARGGAPVGEFETGLVGEHNLWNAVGAIATATALGLSPAAIAAGLASFSGVRRRQELRGVAQGVSVVDDFGHHPTAIRETLRALRGRYARGKLVAAFEPRSATSRRNVFQAEFAEALGYADEAVLGALHAPDGIPPEQRLDPAALVAALRDRNVPAEHLPDVTELVTHLAGRVGPGDTVVFFSSGPFGGACDRLLEQLGDAVTPARPDDAAAIGALLDTCGLPRLGFEAHLADFLVVRDGGQVVGCVGLEVYGEACLLRSLAVTPGRRGEGLGWVLADAAVRHARDRGCGRIFLFTVTAADFFAGKVGFVPIDRDGVDAAVRASQEYEHGCCRDAACMKLDLAAADQRAFG